MNFNGLNTSNEVAPVEKEQRDGYIIESDIVQIKGNIAKNEKELEEAREELNKRTVQLSEVGSENTESVKEYMGLAENKVKHLEELLKSSQDQLNRLEEEKLRKTSN